ncbi:peptidoglycan bridge formation glycyltransferase FemA/FemB family protein [Candidatus Roizmanbacteria bacterium]|nr:peptidoglycan bridge formation glycyltransferase FemA/FemB family protein [Candidatus Roizmanbacteria bacterium]
MDRITPILARSEWNSFFEKNDSPSFLQSWEWGEFQQKLGYHVERVGIGDTVSIQAIAQIITVTAKRGSFLFIPHGPIIQTHLQYMEQEELLADLTTYLKKIAHQRNCTFLRIAPYDLDAPENTQLYQSLGYQPASLYMHAEHMWVLPLNKSEDELLADMRKTTRYLVKRASKDGVEIEKRTDEESVEIFMKLYEKTATRENFTPFSKEYILEEFRAFHKTGNAVFIFGKVKEEYLAGALVVFTKSTGFYHQGASIHTKLPVPYALQWEAIREAKKRGCKIYNFWGIAPDENKKHPWAGLTQFKKGFGGMQINYVPTMDLPIKPAYIITNIYEHLLRWRRGV